MSSGVCRPCGLWRHTENRRARPSRGLQPQHFRGFVDEISMTTAKNLGDRLTSAWFTPTNVELEVRVEGHSAALGTPPVAGSARRSRSRGDADAQHPVTRAQVLQTCEALVWGSMARPARDLWPARAAAKPKSTPAHSSRRRAQPCRPLSRALISLPDRAAPRMRNHGVGARRAPAGSTQPTSDNRCDFEDQRGDGREVGQRSRPQRARQTTSMARFFGHVIGSAAQHPARSRTCGEAPKSREPTLRLLPRIEG